MYGTERDALLVMPVLPGYITSVIQVPSCSSFVADMFVKSFTSRASFISRPLWTP